MQEFLTLTLGEQLAEMARKYPDDNMIKYTDRDYERTWKQFDEECEVIARGFMALGLKKGDKISVWATNVPAWLLTFFGSAKMGGILVTVNTSYKLFELDYQLKQSDTNALVLIDGFKGTSYIDIINQLCPQLAESEPGNLHNPVMPFLKVIIYAGEGDCPAGMVKWSDLKDYIEYFYDELYAPCFELPENVLPADAAAILEAYLPVFDIEDDKDVWFGKIKELCAGLGYTPNVKEYKQTPEKFKGHVGDISSVIRIALTSRRNTPDLHAIIRLLGNDRARQRMNDAINFFAAK